MGALVAKLDVSSRVKRATHERVRAIRWDGRRLVADLRAGGRQLFAATPEALKGGRMWPIVIVATVLLVRRLRRRRAAG
jgi:hypothetical protein